MRDVLPAIDRWIERRERFAVAIVTATWGSSPRPVGSVLAVSEHSEAVGSVSGGCVEAAVISASLEVIQTGVPRRMRFDAVSPEEIWKVGLSCGGEIEVWVFPGWTETDALGWVAAAQAVRDRQATQLILPHPEGGDAFVWALNPPDRLVIVGGAHVSIPLIEMAHTMDFETVLIEPRASLALPSRFPCPPKVVCPKWPEEALQEIGLDSRCFVVTLSHDPKLDDAALRVAMRSPAVYIGALGSRTTHAQRCERFLAEGFTKSEIARIRGPVGLSIGAKSPAEIALSILAEIVQVRHVA